MLHMYGLGLEYRVSSIHCGKQNNVGHPRTSCQTGLAKHVAHRVVNTANNIGNSVDCRFAVAVGLTSKTDHVGMGSA